MASPDTLPPPAAPLLDSPSPAPPDSLSARINRETRQIHTEVNRLITTRLPLALPPFSSTPELYFQGIQSVAQLYYTFEDAWQELIYAFLRGDKSNAQHSYLARLVEPRLWRTQRLEADVEFLSKRVGAQAEVPQELQKRIQDAVAQRPHVLLAYAWVLYMAVFSGGRHIRALLVSAGKEFWSGEGEAGKSFFYFEGREDGEDIRAEFKKRFLEADGLLSDTQKEEVVAEAKWIFEAVVGMVKGLDQRLGTPKGESARDIDGLRQRKRHKQDEVLAALKALAPEKKPQPTMIHPASHWLTEGMSFSSGVLAILLGVALWYGLWSLSPKERLLDWLF